MFPFSSALRFVMCQLKSQGTSMNFHNGLTATVGIRTLTLALTGLWINGARAHAPPTPEAVAAQAQVVVQAERQRVRQRTATELPAVESAAVSNPKAGDLGSPSAAMTASPDSTLSAPLTIKYAGSSPALAVTDTGSNKGILSIISNSRNASSALFGQTNGSGAGLTGYNYGTSGPAGKFTIDNGESAQPGAYAATNGSGPALLATVTNNASESPAVYGQNNASDEGIGVEGDGHVGVFGYTETSIAVSAFAVSGTALLAQSEGSYGVLAEAYGSGTGIYAYSESGYAGIFQGPVQINGSLTVNGVNISSDRALKTGFATIDGKQVLAKIEALPISSWNYKADLGKRHVGPMAQDFHSAFDLGGTDDTHINLTDIAGVSLAAIKELASEMQAKDARIAALEARLSALERHPH